MSQREFRYSKPRGFYRAFGKRMLDLGSVVVAGTLFLPIIAVLCVLVRLFLGSPVFFTQQRPGLHGRPFKLVKFRTMTDRRDENGALLPDAERLTRFGRFLRASSLDELPELWNVLCGHMSLVGPRPLLMQYLPLYSDEQFRRHEVLPGLTGLAQVRGRNALSWSEKFAADVEYVNNLSLALDLSIMFKTLWRIVTAHGVSAAGEATMPAFRGNRSADEN